VFIRVNPWLDSSLVEHAHTIYLSLGGNLGDRAASIARAVEALTAAGLKITRQSSLYETAPVPPAKSSQRMYLNCCLEAETALMPRQLLRVVREIERSLGRRRAPGSEGQPRTIDIDILLYGTSRVQMRDLELPHPRMAERRFVLVPLSEIAPALRHPTLNKTVAELLAELRDPGRVVRYKGLSTPA